MSSIKGIPAYWKFLDQVLAMAPQLGKPKWNKLISIIYKLNGVDTADRMPYHERCDALNKIPVLFATHFQYTVEVFFKFMILDAPLGNTQYYAISVDFKVR